MSVPFDSDDFDVEDEAEVNDEDFDFDDENVEDEDIDGDIDDVPGVKRDGLADMMSKILHQNIGDKTPVLAKRKTTEMKEMQGKDENLSRIKRQRAEKKAEREKQFVVPDHTSADFERQLRKLATRGGNLHNVFLLWNRRVMVTICYHCCCSLPVDQLLVYTGNRLR